MILIFSSNLETNGLFSLDFRTKYSLIHTNSKGQSCSCEANSHSASQEIPPLL